MPSLLATALAALLTATPAAAAPAPGRVLDRVAALVNGDVVTLRELEERAGAELAQADSLPDGPERERARAKALRGAFDAIVSDKLFTAQVKEQNVEVSEAEIDSVINDVKRRNSLDDARLDQALAAQGMDRASYRKAVKRDLESMRLIQLKVRSKVKVTDEDVKNYYQTHPQEFREPDQVRFRLIFLPLSSKAVPAEVARVQETAQGLVSRLRSGEDFAAVAKQSSEAPSRDEGGEMGWMPRGTLNRVLDRVLFATEPGQIADPVRAPDGYYIVQVEERRQGQLQPLTAEVDEKIRDRLVNQQGDMYRTQYLAELRKDAAIEVRLPELRGE